MAKKKTKAKPKVHNVPTRSAEKSGRIRSVPDWLLHMLYGCLGAAVCYLLNPIVVFSPTASKAYLAGLSIFSGVLAFCSSTKLYARYADLIIKIAFACVLIQMSANLALTYEWVTGVKLLNVIAHSMTIPLAIVWFFILKNKAFSAEQSESVYSFNDKIKNKYFQIAGVIVLIISGILIFYKLGYYDIWEDENLVIKAAMGLQEQGLDYLKDGYKRTWLHSFLISGFFNVFGVSEFTGRLPSALFGLIFVVTCFYVFTRWYGIWVLALLVPIVCLMNDKFLILFRYMRMYALLIPVFLYAIYFFYRTITFKAEDGSVKLKSFKGINKRIVYIAGSLILLFLLAHLHKLAMVVLPVLFISILYYTFKSKTREAKYFLYAFTAGCIILAFLAIVVRLHSLRMFAQVYDRLFSSYHPFPQYYAYMFDNGLPYNSTFMILIAGMGLFLSRIANGIKIVLSFSYLLTVIALVSMVFLIEGEGRDYRYIAHIVPFVVGIGLYVWYQAGQMVFRKYLFIWMSIFLIVSSLNLIKDYKRVYVKHPWSPSYSIVYNTLKNRFKPGDAIFVHNVKTYYLDANKLAGDHYYKVPNKKQYTLDQFKEDIFAAKKGWIMWDKHKSHHWQDEVIQYIYSHFKLVHGGQLDDYGVDLFYFDEKMIAN